MSLKIPENVSKKYDVLFSAIDEGRMKIPQFQRDFVWDKEQTAKLLDSIIKGYPIGTFIVWKTFEELRYRKNIGNHQLPDVPKGEPALYILDGQQRITSLYAVKKGVIVEKDGTEVNYKDIGIDLSLDPDDEEPVVFTEQTNDKDWISIFDLLEGALASLVGRYSGVGQLEKIETYKKRLTSYDFSTIEINNYPIDIACEIFTRINTGGTELTLFEIMVAKTFDQEKGFDLALEYSQLVDADTQTDKDLKDANYETIPEATVLQSISGKMVGQVRRKDILRLPKPDLIAAWPEVKKSIFAAIDYLRSHEGIPVSRLLPYNALLVPYSYFFGRNNLQPPSSRQSLLLTQYFWWAALTNRFSSATETKLAQDINRMEQILSDEVPSYRGEEVQLSVEDLKWRNFSAGDSFCKAILCLYAAKGPRSFSSNSTVRLDNSWLLQANSKNYHHFFPRKYLRDNGISDWKANVVLNITIVDDFLNKRSIGIKPPGKYIKDFQKTNKSISETLRTHLIEDIAEFGIWDNDYERFIEKRANLVYNEIYERLNPQI